MSKVNVKPVLLNGEQIQALKTIHSGEGAPEVGHGDRAVNPCCCAQDI